MELSWKQTFDDLQKIRYFPKFLKGHSKLIYGRNRQTNEKIIELGRKIHVDHTFHILSNALTLKMDKKFSPIKMAWLLGTKSLLSSSNFIGTFKVHNVPASTFRTWILTKLTLL